MTVIETKTPAKLLLSFRVFPVSFILNFLISYHYNRIFVDLKDIDNDISCFNEESKLNNKVYLSFYTITQSYEKSNINKEKQMSKNSVRQLIKSMIRHPNNTQSNDQSNSRLFDILEMDSSIHKVDRLFKDINENLS